jgi:hypothetical protein
MQKILRRLIESAKNYGRMQNLIGNITDLRKVLCDYDPSAIIQRYHGNSQELLNCIIIEKAKTDRPILVTKPNILWSRYCRSIIEGASFLNRFRTVQEFRRFVDDYHDNPLTRKDLPQRLSKEIYGIGFALACDFLKEIGYQNYSKPDVYLKKILSKLSLSKNDDDEIVFEAVTRIAKNTGKTAYAVDKLFWLIGSGYFYRSEFNRSEFKIHRHADKFIEWAKPQLE